MNEQTPTIQNTLEQALIKSIDGIQKTGTELVEALYQQAPEVVEQLLMWHGIESLIQCVVGILCLSFIFVHYKIACRCYEKNGVSEWDDSFYYWLPTVFSGIIVSVFSFGTMIDLVNLKWLKIWLAPKVYLLEYLADLVK
jgi:hypothetical protein